MKKFGRLLSLAAVLPLLGAGFVFSAEGESPNRSNNVFVENLVAGDETNESERIANTEAIRQAIKSATDQGIAKIIFPAGRFHFEGAKKGGAQSIVLPSNLWIQGSGREATILVFHPTEAHFKEAAPPPGSIGFHATGRSGIHLSDLGFENSGSRSIHDKQRDCYLPNTQTFANTIAFLFTDCVRCQVENCSFTFGQHGLKFTNTTDGYETNRDNLVSGCFFSRTAGYGLDLERASSTIIENNRFSRCGTDGLKTRSFCRWLTIGRNISEENGRDGFDFYDGLLESTVTGNVARGNHLQGFDIKGNFDEAAKEYPSRENTFSGNIATRNGSHGFSVQQVRNTIFTGNQATLNRQSGFLLNNLQNCVLTGQQAGKNGGHGFYILSMSRSSVTGCLAVDNGWTDGSPVPDGDLVFDGFYLEPPADGIVFSGCVALNGTQTNQQGNQRYGMFFADYPNPVEKKEGGIGVPGSKGGVVLKFQAGSSEGNILNGGRFSGNRLGTSGQPGSGLGGCQEKQQVVNCF